MKTSSAIKPDSADKYQLSVKPPVIFFLTAFLLVGALHAQDGKLRGRVSDIESGEPLIGANVVVESSSLGAATNSDGDYVILSVPPGVYTLRVSYLGYTTSVLSNLEVLSNQTTTQDFELVVTTINLDDIVIRAERPLIQRNTTNTVRVQTQDDLRDLPLRGVQGVVAIQAGVVEQNGDLYMRGGRAGEVGYYVDGAHVTNPVTNRSRVGIIYDALQEIQVQTGGYTAEYGHANSGIVATTSRTGGKRLSFTLDCRTDDFAKPGRQFLGTTSSGFREIIGTTGGSIVPGIRFFLAGQNSYVRNNQTMFLTPFRFTNLMDDGLVRASSKGRPLPGVEIDPMTGDTVRGIVEFKENYLSKNWNDRWMANGNILLDLNELAALPLNIRLSVSLDRNKGLTGARWPNALENYFRPADRLPMTKSENRLFTVKITHLLSQYTFYELTASYQYDYETTYDQQFRTNWMAYFDRQAWAAAGLPTDAWPSRYAGPDDYSTIYQFKFANAYVPNNAYSKRKETGLSVNVDLVSQITANWELKVGGSFDSWTTRAFSVSNIRRLLELLDENDDGIWDAAFNNDYEKRINYLEAGQIDNYGYTYLGQETNGYRLDKSGVLVDRPFRPFYASAYVQNKYEYRDLVINFGLRLEHYDPKINSVDKTLNRATGEYDYWAIDTLANGTIDEGKIRQTEGYQLLLPRISFSFPISEKTVFYSQFGKFSQFPALRNLYSGLRLFNKGISAHDRYGGGRLAFGVRPERTTLFETGVRQLLTENLAFTLTAFYKDMKDQIQLRPTFDSARRFMFYSYQNQDFGTVKGLELTLDLKRTDRLSARLNYSLSKAKAMGGVVAGLSQIPSMIVRAPYDQTHRGSVILDYRFSQGDGGVALQGMGLNAVLSFNSGHGYTKIVERGELGHSTPWDPGVSALHDLTFSHPSESVNESTTPWVFNVDVNFNKVFYFRGFNLDLYMIVLNLLNTKSVVAVYPTTGAPNDDGWLQSSLAQSYREIPMYEEFYRAINVDNRWGIMQTNVGDVYGPPRSIKVGLKVEM